MPSPFAPVTIVELEARLRTRRRAALELAGTWRADAAAALDDLDVSDLLDADTSDGGRNDADRAFRLAAVAATVAHSADAALARIAEGRYGTCDACGSRISLARLRAVPDATTCIDCKRATERPLARLS